MPYAIRTCSTCGHDFRPSSKHRSCPKCRTLASKVPCPKCGELMSRKASSCRSCVDQCGELNPRWRGGRAVHSHGYSMRKAEGHPRVEGRRTKYVMEHILVMEHHIGRYLLPGENVHHINGVKTDNRIENLELWVTSQPSGQRAADLLEWARGIISRYEGVEGIDASANPHAAH